MASYLLVRHADAGAGSRLLGRLSGFHLTAAGLAQSIHLSAVLTPLPVRAIYCSPLERALETAQVIAEPHGLTPEPLESLHEVDFGAWEGHYVEELDKLPEWKQYNKCRTGSVPPGGESIHTVQNRMVETLNKLSQQHTEGKVVIVSHGDPLRAVVAHYLGVPLDMMHRFEISTGSVTALEVSPWGPCITCINFTQTLNAFAKECEEGASHGTRHVSNVV